MAEADDKNKPNKAPVELRAVPLEVGFYMPGDTHAEHRTRRFLCRLMQKYPAGLPGRSKKDFRRICLRRFKIPDRKFLQIWDWAIQKTGAIAYGMSGPRGDRGRKK
jgi:hypothetical protein